MPALLGSLSDWEEIDQREYVRVWRSWYSQCWGLDPEVQRISRGSVHIMAPPTGLGIPGLAYVGLWGAPDTHYYQERI